MGTTFPTPGPGFTSDKHRLNVLPTRQRCGFVVVGDVKIRAGDETRAGKGKATGKAEKSFTMITPTGEKKDVKALMLQHIYASMVDNGRVGCVDVTTRA